MTLEPKKALQTTRKWVVEDRMSRPSTKGLFVKERLVEARESRSITQREVAKALGRSYSTISNWERGEQAPEPASLNQLATTLGVSMGYLLKAMPQHGSSPIFFRSLANATSRARVREKARVRWLQHVSLALQETLQFPPIDIPELIHPGGYARIRTADLERIAMEMRAHWGLGEGPIDNIIMVAENAGVVVGIDEVGSTKIDGQGTWSEADGRPYVLLARDKYTAFRRQMDMAHELSHLVIHRGVTERQLGTDFDLIEYQAKYLAGAFLLPHRSFPAEIASLSLNGFLDMKPRWKVAIGAMIMRAQQLGILNDDAAQLLWKYRATRGWHRREPFDSPDETPVEEPRLLRRSVEMIVDNKVRSKKDLLDFDIGLGADDVELIASLPAGYFSKASANVIRIEPRLRESNEQVGKSQIVPFRRPT
jgi:Zn-dependent peptidase ImmA (M78 family)/DNA-binding transcriptional regulator YiaG